MLLRRLALFFATLALAAPAVADNLAVRVGGGLWNQDPSGYLRYQSTSDSDNADLNNDLHLESDAEGYLYILFEHPVPLVPNVKVMMTSLKNSGNGTISSTFNYGGQTFNASAPITSQLDMDQTDVILYWQLLDNVVSLDLGIDAKIVDAEAVLTSGATTSNNTWDGVVPMLYAAVGVSPMPGLDISLEGSFVGVGDSSVSDYAAKVSYTTDYMLGFEAGYRSMKVDLDDLDGSYSNMTFEGPFIGAYLHF